MSSRITIRTRKRLWLRSGDRCAFPRCEQSLLEPIDGIDDDTVVGIECHIVSREDSPSVARSESSLTPAERERFAELVEDRHGYANLVLMCPRHAITIDDPNGGFDVARVVGMKREHESLVAAKRTHEQRRADDSLLQQAAIVDEWERRVGVDEWDYRYGRIFGDGHPMMSQEHFSALSDTRRWMFSRVWPAGTKPALRAAFDNFRRVAQDLQLLFERYPHEHLAEQGVVAVKRFYNDYRWIERINDHGQLGQMYEWYANLLEDFALELARAANLVCDAVRQTIDARYRVEEGLVVLESGPYIDFMTRLHRPRYATANGWSPYPGLRPFLCVRVQRDEHRGSGGPPQGLSLPGDLPFE